MKISLTTFILLFFLNFQAGLFSSEKVNTANPFSIINVCDFGATPNDGKDDSDAIEKAVSFAKQKSKMLRPPNGSQVGCAPTIYFPSGVFHLKKQIDLNGLMSISGDNGKSIIQWIDDPEVEESQKETMFRVQCYTNRFENIKFIGGKTHLLFQNANINQTIIEIQGCEFQHASGFAVRAIPSGNADHLSTLLIIRDSKFIFNYQCLETYCDITNLLHSWVELRQPQMADAAAFVNKSGRLIFDDMVGVPCADASKGTKNLENARWVDNYSEFQAIRSRFGGEGAGMPVVYHYAPFNPKYPWMGGGRIIITNSCLCAGSMRKNACVIKLFSLPSQIVLRENFSTSNSPFIKVDPSFNIEEILRKIPENKQTNKYVIDSNITFPRSLAENSIPLELKGFINPLRSVYYDEMPEKGYWEKGQILFRKPDSSFSNTGIVNVSDNSLPEWAYFGKTTPFPYGLQKAETLSSGRAKYTFAVPDKISSFSLLLTVGGNPSGNGNGFVARTVKVSLNSIEKNGVLKSYISFSNLNDAIEKDILFPEIESVHFGDMTEGYKIQEFSKSKKVTVIWKNCANSPCASIETLFVK